MLRIGGSTHTMTALRAWVGAMNPLKEGNVSHIMMLPTIEKMSLQIHEGISRKKWS
jgi:hypothetical protein